jgi:hypothetical protein
MEIHEGIMKSISAALIISAIGMAIAAVPAEAAKNGKRKSSAASHAQVQHRASPGMVAYRNGGVRSGPLYNGQDYIGDDPDPSIRSYLIKDMTRYQGSY